MTVQHLPEWRQIAEALPTIVWAARPDGSTIFFNQRWYEYSNLTPEQSLGSGWRQTLHPQDVDRARKIWLASLREETRFEVEYRLRGRDGAYRWFLVQANPVRNERGKIVRWFGTCTDIDDQKRNEQAYVQLYERERRIADTLQRALLPPSLPRLPGLFLDAVYQPDTDEAKVGGDWYDAFELPEGRLALSIGDVAGHGLDAAVLMGRVREALRAAATEESDPGRVLERANAAIELSEEPTMVTALFAVLDRLTLRLNYACAGHPAPLLAKSDGSVEPLLGCGIPLGTGLGSGWETYDCGLQAGSILALYTDGLVESDRDIDAAERRMIAALGRQARGTQQRSALSLVASTIEGRQRDDIAVLTLATSPTPLRDIEMVLPSVPTSARRARLLVERVLREAGIEDERRFEITVAVGEAVNNAIEHAPKLGSEEFTIRARRRASSVAIEIVDQGMWLPKLQMPQAVDPFADRGRGLMLMYALCHDVQVERTPDGTCVRVELPLSA